MRTITDIGVAFLDKLDGKIDHLLKVITGKCDLVGLVPQPAHISGNAVDELLRLCLWVGVVVSQIANSIISFWCLEINPHWFYVPDMKISIGLGRKPKPKPPSCYLQVPFINFRIIALFRQKSRLYVLKLIPKLFQFLLRFCFLVPYYWNVSLTKFGVVLFFYYFQFLIYLFAINTDEFLSQFLRNLWNIKVNITRW